MAPRLRSSARATVSSTCSARARTQFGRRAAQSSASTFPRSSTATRSTSSDHGSGRDRGAAARRTRRGIPGRVRRARSRDRTGSAGVSVRLDAELANRGLARSRTHAARLIAEGRVLVDGSVCEKASTKVSLEQAITVDTDHYVSRAAHKLIAGLDGFGIDVTGRIGLDMGASTGGFTQVLL